MRAARHLCGSLALGLLLLCFAAPVRAEEEEIPSERQVGLVVQGQKLVASFSYRDAFTPAIIRKLSSGLPTRVVVQVNLERPGKDKPLTYWARSVQVVYDLWEEKYIVSVEDDRGRRQARVGSQGEAVALAGQIVQSAVADLNGIAPGPYRIRAVVEVNPVSKEMIENIRRWLAQAPGQKGGAANGSNFFGSFVGIFVDRRIGKADYRRTFVSQTFEVGQP